MQKHHSAQKYVLLQSLAWFNIWRHYGSPIVVLLSCAYRSILDLGIHGNTGTFGIPTLARVHSNIRPMVAKEGWESCGECMCSGRCDAQVYIMHWAYRVAVYNSADSTN
jgi:hypothetical protein